MILIFLNTNKTVGIAILINVNTSLLQLAVFLLHSFNWVVTFIFLSMILSGLICKWAFIIETRILRPNICPRERVKSFRSSFRLTFRLSNVMVNKESHFTTSCYRVLWHVLWSYNQWSSKEFSACILKCWIWRFA